MAGFSADRLSDEVARGLKRGDPSAQAEAYRTLAPAVLGMAQRILGDRGLAEEMVQDTFISVIERASSLKNPKAAVGWVRQTAVNHCLMRLRSPWQQRRDAAPPPEETDPNQDSPRADNLRDLERALQKPRTGDPDGALAARRGRLHAQGDRQGIRQDTELLQVAAGSRLRKAGVGARESSAGQDAIRQKLEVVMTDSRKPPTSDPLAFPDGGADARLQALEARPEVAELRQALQQLPDIEPDPAALGQDSGTRQARRATGPKGGSFSRPFAPYAMAAGLLLAVTAGMLGVNVLRDS